MPPADEIDALYGLPLDEFTKARNDLVRTLRKEGKRDEAATVSALRKPSLAAWVVNQLVRRNGKDVEALVGAATAIRKGDADGDERFRRSVDELVRAARELLSGAGRGTDTVLQEVATTLRATAAVAPDDLTEGRLTSGRTASGFDALAGTVPRRGKRSATPSDATGTKARKRPSVDRAAVEAARRELGEARGEARRLRRGAAQAEREARRAREAAERAERRVEERKAALDAARAGAR
jgi:hypothetical protein